MRQIETVQNEITILDDSVFIELFEIENELERLKEEEIKELLT